MKGSMPPIFVEMINPIYHGGGGSHIDLTDFIMLKQQNFCSELYAKTS